MSRPKLYLPCLAALALLVCFFVVHLSDIEKSKAPDQQLDASLVNAARGLVEDMPTAKVDWSQWLPAYQEATEVDSATRLIIRDKTPVPAGSPRFARIVLKSPE